MALNLRVVVLAVAVCALCVAGWEARRLFVIRQWNTAIGAGMPAGDAPRAAGVRAPAEARFAAAFALGQRGDLQAALNAYRELDGVADAQLRHDAKFNSGNLYLRQALNNRAGADPSATLTLVELAKQSYRDLLREDSGDWDARYNLEKALRLAPDPEEDSAAMTTPPSRLHTATTGRGSGMGLP